MQHVVASCHLPAAFLIPSGNHETGQRSKLHVVFFSEMKCQQPRHCVHSLEASGRRVSHCISVVSISVSFHFWRSALKQRDCLLQAARAIVGFATLVADIAWWAETTMAIYFDVLHASSMQASQRCLAWSRTTRHPNRTIALSSLRPAELRQPKAACEVRAAARQRQVCVSLVHVKTGIQSLSESAPV